MKKYIMSIGIATFMLAPVLAEDAKPMAPAATTPPAAAPAKPAAAKPMGKKKMAKKGGMKKSETMKKPETTTQK